MRRALTAARCSSGSRRRRPGGRPRPRRPRDGRGGARSHRLRPRPRGAVARRRRPHRPRPWEERVPYDWLALLRRDAPVFWQPEVDGRRLLGVHAVRRRRRDLEGLGDVLERARRDVASGPHAGGARGAEVDARHRSAAAHADARAGEQGLHAARDQHLRGADPRPRAGHSRRRVRARRVRLGRSRSRPRSRCGSSPRSWGCPSRTGS